MGEQAVNDIDSLNKLLADVDLDDPSSSTASELAHAAEELMQNLVMARFQDNIDRIHQIGIDAYGIDHEIASEMDELPILLGKILSVMHMALDYEEFVQASGRPWIVALLTAYRLGRRDGEANANQRTD